MVLDAQIMNKIVLEKNGHMQYKFGAYKSDLSQKIAHCKLLGATEEELYEIDLLDKLTNSLFSQDLDHERQMREVGVREQKIVEAELDSKIAIKNFYKEAQNHVTDASRTVERFANEMNAQCNQQIGVIERCSLLLNTLSGLISNVSIRNEQQADSIIREIRREGQTIRQAVHNESQAICANLGNIDKKVNVACEQASTAQQQAAQAQRMAAQAQIIVSTTMPTPSAPPLEPQQ